MFGKPWCGNGERTGRVRHAAFGRVATSNWLEGLRRHSDILILFAFIVTSGTVQRPLLHPCVLKRLVRCSSIPPRRQNTHAAFATSDMR